MRIHHLVAADNVSAGRVVDPGRVRHGTIAAGRVASLAGPVDPRTHLNLDFAAHRLDRCVVVAALRPGAPVLWDGDGFCTALVSEDAYRRLGPVDLGARLAAWRAACRRSASAIQSVAGSTVGSAIESAGVPGAGSGRPQAGGPVC